MISLAERGLRHFKSEDKAKVAQALGVDPALVFNDDADEDLEA